MRIDDILLFTKECLENYDGSHDFFHAIRVGSNAMKMKPQHIDLTLIAALLHDTCDPKYVNKKKALLTIETFLKYYLDSSEIDDIKRAIEQVSFTRLKVNGVPTFATNRSLNIWKIVSQADMLEALGVTGVVRTLMYQGQKENKLEDALDYCRYELIKCVDFITYSQMQEEARKRKISMLKLVNDIKSNDSLHMIAEFIMNSGASKRSFMFVINNIFKLLDAKCMWIEKEYNREVNFTLSK